MDPYRLITFAAAALLLSIAFVFVKYVFRRGEFYLIGVPVRREKEPAQFYFVVIFFAGMLGAFGLFWLYVSLHK